MLEFLIGYACGIVTIIFTVAFSDRKKRQKRDMEKLEIMKMRQPEKR